jgi:hypothetical protein
MSILEKDIEQKASKYAESIGYISLKINVIGQRGWPDHLFINPYGHHLWIEFKKLGKKLSKIQKYRIKQLNEQGASAYWTDNYEAAIRVLNEHSMDTP